MSADCVTVALGCAVGGVPDVGHCTPSEQAAMSSMTIEVQPATPKYVPIPRVYALIHV